MAVLLTRGYGIGNRGLYLYGVRLVANREACEVTCGSPCRAHFSVPSLPSGPLIGPLLSLPGTQIGLLWTRWGRLWSRKCTRPLSVPPVQRKSAPGREARGPKSGPGPVPRGRVHKPTADKSRQEAQCQKTSRGQAFCVLNAKSSVRSVREELFEHTELLLPLATPGGKVPL